MDNYIIHFKSKNLNECANFYNNFTTILKLAKFPYKVIGVPKEFFITYKGNKNVNQLVDKFVRVV